MKIWKNLFGNGDKIHADEIVVGTQEKHDTLSNKIEMVELWSGNTFTITPNGDARVYNILGYR